MKHSLRAVIATSALIGISLNCGAQSTSASSVPPDNTKTNRTDQNHVSASADAQKNDKSDLILTRQIRKSVMADKSLSTYAHNVKIIAVNGTVTLNGVVRSDTEKNAVEMKAVAVAGKANVVDDIKIAPSK